MSRLEWVLEMLDEALDLLALAWTGFRVGRFDLHYLTCRRCGIIFALYP